MSSFLMGYPPHHHVQGAMGSGYEPKFPPSEDYHHLHHNGYAMNGMTGQTNPMDYNYGQNGYNYGHQGIGGTGHFYHHHHHHHPYGSPQMHPTPTIPPPASITPTTPQSNSYAPNTLSNSNSGSVGSLNVSNDNSTNLSGGYYNNYYNTNGHHQSMDLPIQCPSVEPTNTVLGLQELGRYTIKSVSKNCILKCQILEFCILNFFLN